MHSLSKKATHLKGVGRCWEDRLLVNLAQIGTLTLIVAREYWRAE